MSKYAFLAAAASVVSAVAPAQAADLPVAPEPIDYVRVCDAHGSRFYYIPGTETCLRVGGRVRAEFRVRNFGEDENAFGQRDTDGYQMRARGYLYLDSRTATEFGTLRTFTEIYGTNTNDSNSVIVDKAYIQWGGLLAGRNDSNFDFYTGYSYNAQIESYSDATLNQLAYTYSFGNGFSATAAIEDRSSRESNLAINGTNEQYGGTRLPDAILALGVSQGWGSAQVMGALHEVLPNQDYRNAAAGSVNKVGWAVGAGVEVELNNFGLNVGTGTTAAVQFVYTDGASSYGSTGFNDLITDAVYNGSRTKTTKTWNIVGGISQGITDTIEVNLDAGFHDVDGGTNAYDFKQYDATGNIVWKPVKGLLIGPELQYRNVDFSRASGQEDTYELFGNLRIQRTF